MNEIRIKVNSGCVAYEVQDGRAIIVHIKSGAYYDLEPLTTNVWERICKDGGIIVAGTSSQLPRTLNLSMLGNERGVGCLLEYLYKEDLIVCEEIPPNSLDDIAAKPSEYEDDFWLHQTLEIRKHQEMEMFLKLDPILVNECESTAVISGE